jgi:hypothetical protein
MVVLVGCTPAPAPAVVSPSATAADLVTTMVGGHFRVRIGAGALGLAQIAGIDLAAVTEDALQRIDAVLPGPTPDITIDVDPSIAIQEIGVGGITDPRNGAVRIGFSPRPPEGMPIAVHDWLPGNLAHELHHSRRIRAGPGYGMTVGESIVTEGLAVAFEREAFPAAPLSPWGRAIDPATQHRIWPLAQSAWSTPDTALDHQRWFFGTTSEVPRWTGYTLGLEIVTSYLRSHPDTMPSTLFQDTASHILLGSGYSP